MAYLSRNQLLDLGFQKLGENVLVSDKACIYGAEQMEIGDNSRIDDFCVLSGKVRIGRNVHITIFCNVAGGVPGVQIGDFSTLAYGCQVFAQSDDYSGHTMANSTIPKKFKNERFASVEIGDHCILGAGCIVMPGVTLGEGVAAGVRTSFLRDGAPWTIYAGTPAKLLRARERRAYDLAQQYLAEEKRA